MVDAARASAPCAVSSPSRIQSLAKPNRKPLQLAENKHQQPKSIASFCRTLPSATQLANHGSRTAPFLFDTNERTPKKPNLFTTNKKAFLFDAFERFSAVLFDTFERPSIYPFLPPTRHGRIAAL
jgi:hypothetical protein